MGIFCLQIFVRDDTIVPNMTLNDTPIVKILLSQETPLCVPFYHQSDSFYGNGKYFSLIAPEFANTVSQTLCITYWKNIQGVPKKSVNKEISITFEIMNIVQGLHMFRHM